MELKPVYENYNERRLLKDFFELTEQSFEELIPNYPHAIQPLAESEEELDNAVIDNIMGQVIPCLESIKPDLAESLKNIVASIRNIQDIHRVTNIVRAGTFNNMLEMYSEERETIYNLFQLFKRKMISEYQNPIKIINYLIQNIDDNARDYDPIHKRTLGVIRKILKITPKELVKNGEENPSMSAPDHKNNNGGPKVESSPSTGLSADYYDNCDDELQEDGIYSNGTRSIAPSLDLIDPKTNQKVGNVCLIDDKIYKQYKEINKKISSNQILTEEEKHLALNIHEYHMNNDINGTEHFAGCSVFRECDKKGNVKKIKILTKNLTSNDTVNIQVFGDNCLSFKLDSNNKVDLKTLSVRKLVVKGESIEYNKSHVSVDDLFKKSSVENIIVDGYKIELPQKFRTL